MKVLIAMEESGTIRDAFRARGHDAWSCDIQPSRKPGPHIQGSVFDHAVVHGGWDLMIAHPECTFVARSATRWMKLEWRAHMIDMTVAQCKSLMAFPIEQIAIENPIGVLTKRWREWTQIVQPWQFGHRTIKPTCLWLKNLPKLYPTHVIAPPRPQDMTVDDRREWFAVHYAAPGENRARDRSATFTGIAEAMAAQWGNQAMAWFSGQETRLQPGGVSA